MTAAVAAPRPGPGLPRHVASEVPVAPPGTSWRRAASAPRAWPLGGALREGVGEGGRAGASGRGARRCAASQGPAPDTVQNRALAATKQLEQTHSSRPAAPPVVEGRRRSDRGRRGRGDTPRLGRSRRAPTPIPPLARTHRRTAPPPKEPRVGQGDPPTPGQHR